MLEKDNKDTTEHLKRSLVAKEKKVDELTERLESQLQAVEQHRKALNLQHSQQIQQLQDQFNKLNSESEMQGEAVTVFVTVFSCFIFQLKTDSICEIWDCSYETLQVHSVILGPLSGTNYLMI